jgi:CheY-like chemotaxis protein
LPRWPLLEAPPAAGPGDPDMHPLTGIRVLLVEDEADLRDALTLLLMDEGAEVTAVGSPVEARQALERDQPHVLISDLTMPVEDGYDLIRTIRALPPNQGGRIPAAALTGHVDAETRARILQAGYQHHIGKPVEPDRLIAVVAILALKD